MNHGIMLNIDDTHFMYSRYKNGIHPGEKELRDFVRQYAGTNVTDLVLCCGGRISDFPSKIRMCWLDKYHQTVENGIPVDYKNTLLSISKELYEDKGLDPFKIWLEQARACGIRPWLSVRMNDCHDNGDPASFLHSDFFHEHPEYRRIRHREPIGYYDRNFDYGIPAIRDRVLAYLEEILERYAPDGLELDWQREVFCFAPGREDPEILTEFLRSIRAMADTCAKKNGHAVDLCVRLPADPEDALELGFDAAAWARENLVQVICPTARWATTDTDMPVGLWKRLLAGTNTQLAPGIELLMRVAPSETAFYTRDEHVLASAAQYWSEGADRIYLYNYFDDPAPDTNPYWGNSMNAPSHPEMAVQAGHMEKLLRVLGDPDMVYDSPRCHMVTYRDQRPEWRPVRPDLPVKLAKGQPAFFRILTGPVPAGKRVFARLGLRGPVKSVYVNSAPVQFVGEELCRPSFVNEKLRVYEIPGYTGPAAVVEVIAPEDDTVLEYLDVSVM